MSNKKGFGLLKAAVFAGVGYVAGTLFASKSGKETREELKREALQLKDKSQEKAKEVMHTSQEKAVELRDKAQEEFDKRSQELKKFTENLSENVVTLKDEVMEKVPHATTEENEVKSFQNGGEA